MRNICLTVAYEGSRYVGWQIQPNGPSIQATIETAINRLTGETPRLLAAGRTDSGVHALGQVVNFTTDTQIPCDQIRKGLQHFLPDDIVILHSREVSGDFHATYDAVSKRYRYVIYNSQIKHPFLRNYVWYYPAKLNSDSMHVTGQILIGTHDFRSFESHWPNKATSVRTVTECTVARHSGPPMWAENHSNLGHTSDNDFIWIDIVADGFLYNMVRAIVGTMIKVGRGDWRIDSVDDILQSHDRSVAGETAPPQGLYLVSVQYSTDTTA